MQKNETGFRTAEQLYAEELPRLLDRMEKVENKTDTVDTFWEAYNTSRCKTAMLIISVLVVIGFVVSEIYGLQNNLYACFIIITGYWMGRTSKAKDNEIKERKANE